MSNSDRSNRKPSYVSGVSFISDRSINRQSKNNQNSKIRLSNEEVQSIRSSKKSDSNDSTKKKKSVIANLIHYIVPQAFLSKQACNICQESYIPSQLKEFGACGHSFCQPCLKQYVQFKLNSFQLIVCPLEGCKEKLQKSTLVYENILSEQDKLKYVKIHRSLQILSNPNLKSCKNQLCHGILNFKELKPQQAVKLKTPVKCPQCNLQYCPQCYEQKHQGNCEKQIVKFLERNKKFRQCKMCKRVIQKSQGCTHMTCLCGFYFCYMCGQELKLGIHECKIPSNLNCLQQVRWEIEHKQLFYESNYLSFHKYLYCLDLSAQKPVIIRFLYNLVYTVTIYPLSIVFSVLLTIMFIALLFAILFFAFLFIPLSELCSSRDFTITETIHDKCGYFVMAMCILTFYPIFVIVIMSEAIQQVFNDSETSQEIVIALSEIGHGLRNVILMPLVLCVHPQSIEIEQSQQYKVQQ